MGDPFRIMRLVTKAKGSSLTESYEPIDRFFFKIVFIHHVFLLQISAFKDEQFQEEMLLLELLHLQC